MRRTQSKRSSLQKREDGIGIRLKEIRERLGLSQQQFADQLGISKKRLASYEELRVAVRFDLALRICRHFIVSEKWLATGQGGWRILMDLSTEPVTNRVKIDTPFGQAYDEFLGAVYDKVNAEQGGNIRISIHEGESNAFIINLFTYLVETWLTLVHQKDLGRFLTSIMDFGINLMTLYQKDGCLPDVHQLSQNSDTIGERLIPKTRK